MSKRLLGLEAECCALVGQAFPAYWCLCVRQFKTFDPDSFVRSGLYR